MHDELVAAMKAQMMALRVGNGFDEASQMGSCINSARVKFAQEHVDDAVAKGATVECGGGPLEGAPEGGCFFTPTLLTNATKQMRVFKEETFAPVMSVFKCVYKPTSMFLFDVDLHMQTNR